MSCLCNRGPRASLEGAAVKIKCLCPNCYHPVTVVGLRNVGWVACTKCGHVFKVADSAEGGEPKSALPPDSPHLGLRP